jgi:elongation factor Ts
LNFHGLFFRETIVIKRAAKLAPPSPNGVLAAYVHGKVGGSILPSHIQLGKATGVVHMTVDGENVSATQQALKDSVGRKLAMHVVAAKPLFLSSQNVPADFVEKELAIFREQSKEDAGKKKPEVIEKIIQGKVNKRLGEVCLLGQNHMAEEGNPVVKKFVDTFAANQKSKVEVTDFTLWNLNQA